MAEQDSRYSEERSAGHAGEAAPGEELGGATATTDADRVAGAAAPSGANQDVGPAAPSAPSSGRVRGGGDPVHAAGPPEHREDDKPSMGGPTGATTGIAGGIDDEEERE